MLPKTNKTQQEKTGLEQSEYKTIFLAVGLIGILLLSYPSLILFLKPSNDTQFSELYLLGSDKKAQNYPFNIIPNKEYSVFAGLTNHLQKTTYYMVSIKLLNTIDPLPKQATNPQQPLYTIRFILAPEQKTETLLKFSIEQLIFSNTEATIIDFNINGQTHQVNKSTVWDSTKSTFAYNLVFELSIYQENTETFEYQNQFVSLNFNATKS